MAWILLATAGQFLNAIVAILDKYIVTDEKALPKPFVYAFYSCLVTGGWIVIYSLSLIPGLAAIGVPQLSNVHVPTIQVVGMSFLAAYTFFMALVSMYDGLKHADASDVIPVIGAVSAISTFGIVVSLLGYTADPQFHRGDSHPGVWNPTGFTNAIFWWGSIARGARRSLFCTALYCHEGFVSRN